jgi:16S rRNA (uracil1498-N3)-methyltransferase
VPKLRRIRLTPDERTPEGVSFSKKNAHYIRKVLRLKPGDVLEGFDGSSTWLIRLLPPVRGFARGEILQSSQHEVSNELEIRLAFCCVRPGPVEEILRHGTELGISTFIPILSSRTGRRPEGRKSRWDSIVAAATAQSGRTTLPVVEDPIELEEYVSRDSSILKRILLSLTPTSRPLPEILQHGDASPVEILTGPEGGFESWEEALALESGFEPARLVTSVLRTETAAIVAAGMVAAWYHWHNEKDNFGDTPPAL